ncbi:unnamed protein product [Notodromas monacha]|uniref:Multiple inositol polyphosphate phosphatase 1 n=1 Tax=Notodromas monacha TaxID=399045 RepID=A0A7R9BIJ0_9CRUS|nr:unnamed protein product [Notodromas monacha]CAG0914749.1 unnamed protein product [Notodromas monacha]
MGGEKLPAVILAVVYLMVLGVDAKKCFGLRNGGILDYTGMSTKTPYAFLMTTDQNKVKADPPGCTPLTFMMLGRHGTRYPSNEDVLVATKLLPVLINATLTAHEKSNRGTLTPDVLRDFRQWRLPFPMGADDQIHPIGIEEWHILAETYRTRFSSFLNKNLENTDIKFISSYKNRTIASAEAFADGLFGDNGHVISIEDKTKILRFYKYCQRWKEEIDENPETSLFEARNFEKSCPFQDMLDRVTAKLGLDRRLSPLDIEIIYGECQMETAHCPCCKSFYPSTASEQIMLDEMNGFHHLDSETCRTCAMPSPWCKIFSEDDLKVLEFWDDLKKYWQDGYGHSLNYEQSCLLIKELVDQFT